MRYGFSMPIHSKKLRISGESEAEFCSRSLLDRLSVNRFQSLRYDFSRTGISSSSLSNRDLFIPEKEAMKTRLKYNEHQMTHNNFS